MTSKNWLSQITDFANNSDFMIRWYGGYCSDPLHFQRHHILGRKAKRKINLVSVPVGEWVVIPVPFELHDVSSNNGMNVTHYKRAFESIIGTQKEIFEDMVNCMKQEGYTIPFDDELIGAI